ncbi:MAG: single-stranded-DNA-specific exonuclease RecJ [Bacteroidetes bacterium]|nr:single-stranded-DNA-specific exonuclease RecJ [Bacteroidota bacterium]
MQARWKINTGFDKLLAGKLQNELNVDTVTSQLLVQRGITDYESAKQFFRPSLDALHDPFLMKDMDVAINRINKALSTKEKILVYGDYDVDGTTAVALVYSFLKSYDANAGFYIPDRYEEGYGISFKGIDFAAANGYSLIIALDCGIKSIDKVDYANEKEVDFIICDHHLPGEELPKALAVLDPKRKDCPYPYKELTGCGLGYKLCQAILRSNKQDEKYLESYIDLVAVSIAADIVPITGENRVLAHYGLKRVNALSRVGFRAVIDLNKLKKELTISDLVFVLAPRINAAGRIEHGSKAVELLIADSIEKAEEIAKHINHTNSLRKDLDQAITGEAIQIIESDETLIAKKSTVVYSENWHKGVVGIVASRLVERFYKPTIVLTQSNGRITGSARSVKDFDVYEAIEACSELLEQFGGHKYAAGLTLIPENIVLFQEKFERIVSSTITEEMLIPELEIDVEVSFKDLSEKFIRILKQFAPHGPGNMTPVFVSDHIFDTGNARVVGSNHLKLELFQEQNPTVRFQAIAFDKGELLPNFQNQIPARICYQLQDNLFNGKTTTQLVVKEIVFS